MSDDSSPLRSLFDAQRQLISNGQEFVEHTVRAPVEMNAAVRESLEQQRRFQRETLEMTHDALRGLVETVEAADSGDTSEARQALDNGFETLLDGHEGVFNGVDESYADAIEGLEEAAEELSEQVETLVELTERLEERTVETVESVTGGELDDLLAETLGDLDEDIETSGVEGPEAVERQREDIEAVRERVEHLQDELIDAIEDADEPDARVDDSGGTGEVTDTRETDESGVSEGSP